MSKLKIKDTDYAELKRQVEAVLAGRPTGTTTEALQSTRTRWGIFWQAHNPRSLFLNTLYQYLNDDNIDSALKQIMRDYNGK